MDNSVAIAKSEDQQFAQSLPAETAN